MKTVVPLVVAGMSSAALAQWYNGEPDLVDALPCEVNTEVAAALIFEEFDHPHGEESIDYIWGNFLMDFEAVGFVYEIRSGMSSGFGGTLLASGDTDGVYGQSRNHFDGSGYLGYWFAADIPDVPLGAGRYWLAFAPKGEGSGRALVQTTSHADGYGSPLDGGGLFHSSHFGANYEPVADRFGADYAASFGVSVTPAPGVLPLLGVWGLVARRRR